MMSLMAQPSITDNELLSYLDESLPVEKMASIEKELRKSEGLRHRTSSLFRYRFDCTAGSQFSGM